MAGELIRVDGVSGWVNMATGLSLCAATWAQVSASDFATLLAAGEEDYPEFEMRVDVTTGTPVENEVLQVALRMSNGANQSPAPSGDFAPNYVGGVVLDNQAGNYYKDGLSILSKNATVYVKTATAITVSIYIKAKTFNAAV